MEEVHQVQIQTTREKISNWTTWIKEIVDNFIDDVLNFFPCNRTSKNEVYSHHHHISTDSADYITTNHVQQNNYLRKRCRDIDEISNGNCNDSNGNNIKNSSNTRILFIDESNLTNESKLCGNKANETNDNVDDANANADTNITIIVKKIQ